MIKTFKLEDYAGANDFIATVVEPQVTITDNVIAVTYQTTKDEYETFFTAFMLEGLKRNLFNERIRKVALDAEFAEAKDAGTNMPLYDELNAKQKEADMNIRRFEAKIAALEAWQTSKS